MYHLPVVQWDSDGSDNEEQVVEKVPRQGYRIFRRLNIDWISDEAFISRFRLSKGTVFKILQMTEPLLSFNHKRSRYISPLYRLLIALRFYASGSFQVVVADFIGCCRSTVCVVLPKVSAAIAHLLPQFIQMPKTAYEMREASKGFYQLAKFPSVIGAIDCTHVKIQSPGGDQAELFRNRKGGSSATGKIFNPRVDYELVLKVFNEEFATRWAEQPKSPATGLDGFEELVMLGAGSFGKVKLVKEKLTGNYHAAKILSRDQIVKTKQVSHVYNEKRVLRSIKFPFLISLNFSTKDNDNLYLGMPFVNGGELFTYHRRVRKFNEKQARFYAAQVFLAFEYLHYLKLLYRDLKPENVLIDSNGYIKLTDFGFAKVVENRTLTLCGTPEYLAPEVIQSKPYSTSVDWWAFGILLYELVAGNSPFSPHHRDVMVMYGKIVDGEFKMPHSFSASLKNLIENLLQVDMTKRFGNLINGNKDIKHHDWFKTVDWYGLLNQEITPPYVPTIANMEDVSNFDKFPRTKEQPKSKICKHCELFEDF